MSLIRQGNFGAFSANVAPHLQRPAFDSLTQLAAAIGTVLQANSGDCVDFYEGDYPAEQPWTAGEERHEGASSAITLTRIGG
ncbi:hypothetical protein [Sorangium sp. So ce1097]|uniref:hypothetical protein n=1 Tax=Sorangium sp. So ce1097 TaxID=3133330 RepID=UPI003F5DF590